MSRILLVDLDDTLLNNDIDAFLPHYLKAFGAYVAEQVDPKKFTQTLLAATSMMVKNRQNDYFTMFADSARIASRAAKAMQKAFANDMIDLEELRAELGVVPVREGPGSWYSRPDLLAALG